MDFGGYFSAALEGGSNVLLFLHSKTKKILHVLLVHPGLCVGSDFVQSTRGSILRVSKAPACCCAF